MLIVLYLYFDHQPKFKSIINKNLFIEFTSILNAKPTNGAANERVESSLIVFFSFLINKL